MAQIVVCGLIKGGTGKSTVVRNLSFALAQAGYRVCIVDDDAQANLTISCGIDNPAELPITMGQLMELEMNGEELPDPSQYIRPVNGVDLIPSSRYLSVIENRMRMELGCESILSSILNPLRDRYDYIFIDIGPTEGILTVNALYAADCILIPMDLQIFALAGVRELLTTVTKLRRRIKPNLRVAGIVFNRYESITNLSEQIMEDTRDAYGAKITIFRSAIPQTVDIGSAHYCSKPVALYKPRCRAAKAFADLANEFALECPAHMGGEASCH